jgi:hypothetical protein
VTLEVFEVVGLSQWHLKDCHSLYSHVFQVMEPYYPFKNSSVEDFSIGLESCEGHHSGYCNGPLKSGSTYRVKVRAFTAPDKFTDTHYSFPIQTGEFVGQHVMLFERMV